MLGGRGRSRRRGWPRQPSATPTAESPKDTAAGIGAGPRSRVKPGEYLADELALMLRHQPYQLRCLLTRSRRLAAGLPTVWEALQRGDLDAEQIRVIEPAAPRVTETATLAAIDEQVVHPNGGSPSYKVSTACSPQ